MLTKIKQGPRGQGVEGNLVRSYEFGVTSGKKEGTYGQRET